MKHTFIKDEYCVSCLEVQVQQPFKRQELKKYMNQTKHKIFSFD
jgi:hypothetical protein